MAVTAVDRPVDYADLAKKAVAAGVITLILGSLLVGLETVSTVNGILLSPRYRALVCAAVGVGVVYFLMELLKIGRTLPALIGGLAMIAAFAVLEWAKIEGLPLGDQLPFNSWVVNWGVMLVPISLVLRALIMMRAAGRGPVVQQAGHREDRFAAFYLKYNKVFGSILIVIAVALPFAPFADRRLVDIGTLVLTYVMLGWGLNIVVGLA